MAMKKFGQQDKVNKGTSKDEWGVLKHWSYKTPNGQIRAQLTPDDTGHGHLEVRHYDPTRLPHYRKRLEWHEAQLIGSCTVAVEDEVKGLDSKVALEHINDLIEVHDDAFDKWNGRTIQVKGWDKKEWEDARQVVCGAYVTFAFDGTRVEWVQYNDGRSQMESVYVRDYTDDEAARVFDSLMSDYEAKVEFTQQYLDGLREAFANGRPASEVTKPGNVLIGGYDMAKLKDMVDLRAASRKEEAVA